MVYPTIRLLSVRECCRSANFSRATFYRLTKADPHFPHLIRIGGLTRVRADDWAAYIDRLAKHAGRR